MNDFQVLKITDEENDEKVLLLGEGIVILLQSNILQNSVLFYFWDLENYTFFLLSLLLYNH